MRLHAKNLGGVLTVAGLSTASLLASTAFTGLRAEVIDISTHDTAQVASVDGNGTITIQASGSVKPASPNDHAISIFPLVGVPGPWTVNVDGALEVTGPGPDVYGIFMYTGGTVNVGTTGSVRGSTGAISIQVGAATVTNDGYISASEIAVHALMGGTITNTTTGIMSGGVVFAAAGAPEGAFFNHGSISGNGTGYGVLMNAGGTATNSGTIDFLNSGTGFLARGNLDLNNTATGIMRASGAAASGVQVLIGGVVVAANAGTIEGTDNGLTVSQGSADITNSGTIRGARGVNLSTTTAATFRQTAGLVDGVTEGLNIATSGAIVVDISGGAVTSDLTNAASVGVRLAGTGAAQMTVQNATISGAGAAIQGGAGTLSLKLLGGSAITGDVNLGSGASQVELHTGAILNGNILGQGGVDALKLIGPGSGSFSGNITGVETLDIATTGTWTLSGASSFANGTTVSSGTLRANGSLAGATNVLAGATLGGSGTLAGLTTIASGGSLAPGNSIGTLRFANGLNFGAGSFYDVEIAAGGTVSGTHNDWASVTGTLNIDPTAQLRVRAGDADATGASYGFSQTYTIATATARAGAFNPTVEENFAFLDGQLRYDATNVYLTMQRNDLTVADLAITANQRAAAGALGALGSSDPVTGALLGQSQAGARRAMDLASGEAHASGQHLVDQTFALFARSLNDHGAGNAGASAPVAPLAYADGLSVASLVAIDELTSSFAPAHSAWLAPVAGRGTVYANGNAAAVDWWSGGLTGGYDVETVLAGGDARFGIGLGYLAGGATIADRASMLASQGGYVGASGDWSDGALSLSGAIGYGASQISSTRNIAFGGLNRTAAASYWTHTLGAAFEASYGFELSSGFTVSPTGTLALQWSQHSGAPETGAGSLNATLDPASNLRAITGLGLDLAYEMILDDGAVLTLSGRALWEHGFGDLAPDQTLALAGGGAPFTITGPDESRDRLRIGAGLSYQPSDAIALALNYDGVFSASQQVHAGRVGIQFML